MKVHLLILFALVMLVASASGLSLTFQNPDDFSAQVTCLGISGLSCSWVHNTTGGNSYLDANGAAVSATALPMTYSAMTSSQAGAIVNARLYDSSYTLMAVMSSGLLDKYDRIEMKMVGGDAFLYRNGVQVATQAGLLQNPSYVSWTSSLTDDVIWGDTESRYIFGVPEDGYFLMKDLLNPAASGFYRQNLTNPTNPTLITSYTFPTTFGKSTGTAETIVFNNYGGGNYLSYNTGAAYAGEIYWNMTTFFSGSLAAPYGLYTVTIPGSTKYSDTIPYIGSGASINFDKNSYAVGETAVATVIVSDGYYDLATYSYHVVIQDIYGTKVYDQPISFSISPHTGNASYTWLTTDGEGVYYGLIYAKRLSDNVELLMNYDTADLTSTFIVNGYVFNAETAGVLSGARVNVTQGVTTDSVLSATDGNYTSSSAFISNQPTTIVASKTGYETYQHVFTPLYAGSIQINLTLIPTNPTHTGIALGGIARTPPYNRTVNSATVTINKTGVGNYVATTNSVGYYIQNSMPNGTIWDIWGSKTGFSNSTIYQKLVMGI